MRLTTSEVLGVIQVGSKSDLPPDVLTSELSRRFPSFGIETLPAIANPSEAYDSSRGQYHSTRLLVHLEKHLQTVAVTRLLGIAAFDLYVPGMNFVFGEARCPGKVAVISTRRLKSSSSKSPSFEKRVLKEAVHEVGHMLGLLHCSDARCVMHFSEHIGDTDRKDSVFCEVCRPELERLRDG